jgi:3-keto-5-aminohexanoate cleavage enzyme
MADGNHLNLGESAEVDGAGWLYPPLIINSALTGIIPSKKDSTHVPITPAEIALDAKRCYEAGTRIVHVHARDGNGEATWEPSIYAEIIGRIRESCPQLIVCTSTSGRNFQEIEKRSAVLRLEGKLRPDMASLTLGSMNFPKQASVNPPAVVQGLAEIMHENGIKPELEVFEQGMIEYSHYLIEKAILKPPFYFNMFMGSLGTLSAKPATLANMVNALPEGTVWAAAGVGRFQYYVNAMSVAMQGNVRVGIEDNIWHDAKRTQRATNVGLVERIASLAATMGRRLASAAEVRAALGIQPLQA